jgi:hypothetical protein
MGRRLRATARTVAVARDRAEGGGADEVVDGDGRGGGVGPAERGEVVGVRDE